MDITLPREQLIALGAGQRSSYLVQQAGYTLGLAHAEEGALEELAGDAELLEHTTQFLDAVRSATRDRELLAEEAKALTTAQNRKLREARVWRRKVAKRAQRARRLGNVQVPVTLTEIGRAHGLADFLASMNGALGALEGSVAHLGGARAAALLEEGRRLHAELSSADSAQETARLASLPAKVQEFFAAKGRLYVAIKAVNDAGHELHAGDPARAGAYNLKILHRSGARGAAKPGPEGGGAPA